MKVQYDNDYAIHNYDSEHSLLIHINKLHLMVRNSMGNNTLRTHNLLDCKERGEINVTDKNVFSNTSCKMFYFFNKISLLTGRVDYKTWRLNLYHLDTKTTCATWKQVPFSRFSISCSLFDLENCIPVSHRADGVIVVSIPNDLAKHIVFHIFSQKTSGKQQAHCCLFSSLALLKFSHVK